MKYECDVIQDLLPLYQDEICSDKSKKIIEEHLKECSNCKSIVGKLNNYDVDNMLTNERESVLMAHEKKENERTFTIGIVASGILMIPVIVCLICNIAIGHGLDWFFIVLTSMILIASITAVPLLVKKKKIIWTIMSFTGSLILLLFTCCIYTKGNWFWVTGVACILGLSVVFAPYVINNINFPENIVKHKALFVLLWDTIWLYLLLVTCGIFVNGGKMYWKTAMSVSTYSIIFIFVVFFIIRYTKINKWNKAGWSIIFSGIWFSITNDVMNFLLGSSNSQGLKNINFKNGFYTEDWAVFNANLMLMILIVSIIVGVCVMIIGKIHAAKGKKYEEKK